MWEGAQLKSLLIYIFNSDMGKRGKSHKLNHCWLNLSKIDYLPYKLP